MRAIRLPSLRQSHCRKAWEVYGDGTLSRNSLTGSAGRIGKPTSTSAIIRYFNAVLRTSTLRYQPLLDAWTNHNPPREAIKTTRSPIAVQSKEEVRTELDLDNTSSTARQLATKQDPHLPVRPRVINQHAKPSLPTIQTSIDQQSNSAFRIDLRSSLTDEQIDESNSQRDQH